jgi:hypothetical protein
LPGPSRRPGLPGLRSPARLPALDPVIDTGPALLVLLVGAAAGGLGVGLWVVARRLRQLVETSQRGEPDAALTVLQREVEAVRAQVSQQLGDVQQGMTTQLSAVTSEVSRRLQEGLALMQAGQSSMGQRLDQASAVVRAV